MKHYIVKDEEGNVGRYIRHKPPDPSNHVDDEEAKGLSVEEVDDVRNHPTDEWLTSLNERLSNPGN